MRDRFIVLGVVAVAIVLLLLGFHQIYPDFGLWVEMNPTLVIGSLVVLFGVLALILFRPRGFVFPLNIWGVLGILLGVGILVFLFLYFEIPQYLVLHVLTLVLTWIFIARATGGVQPDVTRLIGWSLALVLTSVLVFTNIDLEPTWLFGLMTGGVPFLVLLTLVLTRVPSAATVQYLSMIVETSVCFVLLYAVAAIVGLPMQDRLAYAVFLAPVLYAIVPLFPTTTVTPAQRWWAIALGGGLAVVYTIIKFGLPMIDFSGDVLTWTWRIVLLGLIALGVFLLSDRYPALTTVRQWLLIGLVAILLFPEIIDMLSYVFSWLPLILTVALIAWVWSVDDINDVMKWIISGVIIAVIWWSRVEPVWAWITSFDDLEGLGWWVVLILLIALIGWGSWTLFRSSWLTTALVGGIIVYGLATAPGATNNNSLGTNTRNNNVPVPTTVPAPKAPTYEGSTKHPVDDSATVLQE